jgi:carboxymethylenebutenolidase
MDCYLAYPAAKGRYPLVIVFMDVWGLREELFEMARRVAAKGYCCAVPDLFHRHGRLDFERRHPDGRTVSFDALPLEVRQHMQTYSRQVVRKTLVEDLTALFAASGSWPVSTGPVGVVGFCLGGRAAFYAGQAFPEKVRAVACLHGTVLISDDAAITAHTQFDRMQGEVYCSFGECDSHAPPAIARKIQEMFAELGSAAYQAQIHKGAHHGYTMPDRDVYDAAAAERDWAAIFAMFDRQLRERSR